MLQQNDIADGYLKLRWTVADLYRINLCCMLKLNPENDEIYEFHGLKVLIDKYDKPVLDGTTIDFKQSLMGGGFQIDNLMQLLHAVVVVHLETAKVAGSPEDC